jgi:RimJ/RimL family protein N-acetyltransferase
VGAPPADFDIRYSASEDLDHLHRWLQDPKERDPFPFEGDFETQEALKNWIGFSKFYASLTGIRGEVPCAIGTLFLMPYRKVAHRASFYLMVAPNQRKQGIGTSMLRNLLHLAQTRFRLESVQAEFYGNNEPFRSLLEGQRFSTLFEQGHFFKLNDHLLPRIVMERRLHE